jgi:hypothetical protein
MIEKTKARLDEARSLLRKLQGERSKQVQHAKRTASPEFFSLLHAFITVSRTVIWVLQSEEREKYDAWKSSPGATLSNDEDQVFKHVVEMRNSIEKRGHPGIVARTERVTIPENPDPFHGSQYFGLPEWGRPTTMVEVYYVEGTDHEVASICEQYLAILTKLVDDFERKHSEP